MKKKEFIDLLIDKLYFLELEEINQILLYYENDIEIRLKCKEKEKNIINSYGDIDVLVKNILKKRKIEKINKIKNCAKKFTSFINTNVKKIIQKQKRKRKKIITKKKTKQKKVKSQKRIKEEIKKLNSIIKYILLYLMTILFFINSTLLFSTLIAFIDGVKLLGIIIILFSLSLIYLMIIINSDNYYNFSRLNKSIKLSVLIFLILLLSSGISITIHEIYKVTYIKDISNKYTLYKSENKFKVKENAKKFNIYFNSYYKNNYDLVIDDTLGDYIKIEAKYYECVNDLYYREGKDSLYISLSENTRDIISFYIENFRDKKIYSYKELSRYEIIIYVSSELKKKLDIHD